MSGTIESKICEARFRARMLYNELDKVKTEIKDSTLEQCGTNIGSIRGGCDLKVYRNLKGHENKICKFVWNSNSTSILSCSQDGYMIIWDAVTGFKKNLIALDNPWVLTCGFSPDDKLIACGGLDNCCTIYRLNEFETQEIDCKNNGNEISMFGINNHSLLSIFKGHTAYISDCKFLNNTKLITSSGDMTCCLWDITKGAQISSFNDHLGDVMTIDLMDNHHLFISGSSDGYVNLWDIRKSQPVQNIFITNNDVTTIRGFNNGQSFISGSDDGILRLIDLRSDCELNSYNLFNDTNFLRSNNYSSLTNYRNSIISTNSYDIPSVMSIDISKSYRLIYGCYSEYGCVIWDSIKNEIVGNLGTNMGKTNQVSVSYDGLAVATANWDSNIRIWSI